MWRFALAAALWAARPSSAGGACTPVQLAFANPCSDDGLVVNKTVIFSPSNFGVVALSAFADFAWLASARET
jgi:hypothetical protein